MKREIKKAISGIVLIGSFMAIMIFVEFEQASSNSSYGLLVIPLIIVFFLGMIGFITFSKNGWNDFGTALLLGPSILLFRNRNLEEQTGKEDRMDQKKEDEYYKKRSGR